MVNTSPEKFAALFNEKYPGAYRQITAQDIREMTTCCLIGRYSFYGRDDLETVRGILSYEKLCEHHSSTKDKEVKLPICKLCRQILPDNSSRKVGRPREYCTACESKRNRERQKDLRHRSRKHVKITDI